MVHVERFLKEKHYETIAGWWKFHDWPVVPISHLSQTGIVVFIEGQMAAAGWVYKTDSAFCLLEWIVANPEVRKDKRTTALSTLIETAKEAAASLGFLSIFIAAKHESLISRLEKHGFKVCDTNVKNLIFNIQGVKHA